MNIFVTKNGSRLGPLTVGQIRAEVEGQRILLSDLAWSEGQSEWKPLSQLNHIVDAVIPPTSSTIVATTLAVVSATVPKPKVILPSAVQRKSWLGIFLLCFCVCQQCCKGQSSVTLGPQITLLADTNALGLEYFPDMNISLLKRSPVMQLLLAAGTSSYRVTGSDLQHLTASSLVLAAGPTNSIDNGGDWIGSSYFNSNGNMYVFYHVEDHQNMPLLQGGIPGFYARVCVGVSTNGGTNITKLGPIIESVLPKNTNGYPDQGAGECSIVADISGKYLLAYYTDHSRWNNRGVQICLARKLIDAPLSTNGWLKWSNGAFTEPGFGGMDTPVMNMGSADAFLPDVSYCQKLGLYVMAFNVNPEQEDNGPTPTNSGVYFSFSSDGISWSTPQQIIRQWSVPMTGKPLAMHPTIIWDDAQGVTGQGWLTYAYSPAWGDPSSGDTPHYLVGQRLTISNNLETPYHGIRQAVPGLVHVENYDEGGEGIAYHDSDTTNVGVAYRNDGVDVGIDFKGGCVLGWIVGGEWTEYSITVAKSTNYTFGALVASTTNIGYFHLEFDGIDRTGPIFAPNTGSWIDYQQAVVTNVPLTAGDHRMRVVFDNGWLNLGAIESSDAPAVPPIFDSIVGTATNVYQLRFIISPGKTNVLQMSTDLNNWTTLSSYVRTNGVYLFSHTNSSRTEFYRLLAY